MAVVLGILCCGRFSTFSRPEVLASTERQYKLNLVFVPFHYPDKNAFLKDRDILVRKLRATAPFSEFPQTIAVHDLEISENETRTISFSEEGTPPVSVAPDLLKDVFDKVGANYKLILLDKTGGIGCSEFSSPEATSVIVLGRQRFRNEALFANGFLHELGHSLGLRDESPKGSGRACEPGYPNCAPTKQDAEKWWGDLAGKDAWTGFFQGCCGRPDHVRPTAVSVMNDASEASGFGPVNERYLRKVLESYE